MAKNKIDVSIIMPAYNTEKYIEEAIDSICTQKGCSYELIIINDGSTDNTEEIIQKKKKEYSNIILINQKNSGLSYSRGVGLKKAKGKYVYFVDSDDYIAKNSLSFMFNEAENNKLDCLMINAIFKDELKNEFGKRMNNKKVISKTKNTDILNGQSILIDMITKREWRYAIWLYFIRRDKLKNIDFFKEYIHEDSAFNYQLLNKINRIKFIDKNIYIYRLRKNSIMSKKTSMLNIKSYINAYKIIYKTNNKKKIKYENLLFEMRILDQIIESYSYLNRTEKVKANNEFKAMISLLKKRHNYYIDKYRDFFNQKKYNYKKNQVEKCIDYLEVDIVDHCNLNCKNCSHYSPLTKPKFMELNQFEKDIKRLSNITNKKLKRIVLMGGEPLLHKDIINFIKTVNKYLPKTQLEILSNGILIKKMNKDFWNTCRKCRVQINITPYPININYYEIFNMILDNKLDLFIYDNGEIKDKKFNVFEFDYSKKQNKKRNFINCSMSKSCANLKNGKIYICPIINNIDRYNNYYHKNLEVLDDDYLDIYKISNAEEIYKFLSKPASFCRYCNLNTNKKIKWERFSR